MTVHHARSTVWGCALFFISLTTMTATKEAYPKTSVGEFEIKTLPSATLIVSRSDQGYFEEDNQLFRPLFRYIQDRNIPMTTPVEAKMEPGEMFFYIGEGIEAETPEDTDSVTVQKLPQRTVASLGVRGSYSASNFEEAKKRLEEWLARQTEWKPAGDAKGVFWDGPFTLWFLKRFEVHIPVQQAES